MVVFWQVILDMECIVCVMSCVITYAPPFDQRLGCCFGNFIVAIGLSFRYLQPSCLVTLCTLLLAVQSNIVPINQWHMTWQGLCLFWYYVLAWIIICRKSSLWCLRQWFFLYCSGTHALTARRFTPSTAHSYLTQERTALGWNSAVISVGSGTHRQGCRRRIGQNTVMRGLLGVPLVGRGWYEFMLKFVVILAVCNNNKNKKTGCP